MPSLNMRRKRNNKPLTLGLKWSEKENNLPQLVEVEGVIQAKLNEECLRRTRELNLRVRGLPPLEASLYPLQIGTSFLHNTLDLKDITLERAWMGPNSTLLLRFWSLEDRLRALWAKRRLILLPTTHKIFLEVDLTKTQ
jgi:hypothetical protein